MEPQAQFQLSLASSPDVCGNKEIYFSKLCLERYECGDIQYNWLFSYLNSSKGIFGLNQGQNLGMGFLIFGITVCTNLMVS